MPKFSLQMLATIGFFSTTFAFAVNILFATLKLTNLLDIRFQYLLSEKVISITVFSPSIDLLVWVLSLVLVIAASMAGATFHPGSPRWILILHLLSLASLSAFLIDDRTGSFFAIPLGMITVGLSIFYSDRLFAVGKKEAASLILVPLTLLLVFFESASLSSWIWNAFSYEVPFSTGLRWKFPWIDLQLFNVLYPLMPFLFLAFLYSWIWIPALRHIVARIRRDRPPIVQTQNEKRLSRKLVVVGLLVSMVAASFIAYYPYLHLPNATLVGVDSIDYYNWLKEMMQQGLASGLGKDRPLFNLLMYSIAYTFGLSPEVVIRILPVIFAVCLNLAVFWFVKVGTKNLRLALASSLFSSFSFYLTVGMFAYLLANWLGLIEVFLLLTFFLKSFEKNRWRNILVSAIIGMALLLTHPYTWNVSIVILLSFLAWTLLRRKSITEAKLEASNSTVLLVSNIIFYFIYTRIPIGTGVGSGSEGVLANLMSHVGIPNPLQLYNGVGSMVETWALGIFGNPLLVVLAVVGMFLIVGSKDRFHRILQLWVIVPSLALLAISSEQDFYFRFIYLIPFQILAAVGLNWITYKLGDKLKTSEDRYFILEIFLVALVMLFLFNYSLRSVDQAMTHIIEP